MAKFNNSKTYGIEIEFSWNGRCPSYEFIAQKISEAGVPCMTPRNHYNHDDSMTTWKIVQDGSVNGGGELVSPILNGLVGKEQLRTVLRTIKELGAKTDRSCGIHVHHAASDMNGKALANVAEVYKAHESVIDQFMSESRRRSNNGYCASMNNGVTFYENASDSLFDNLNGESSRQDKGLLVERISRGRYHKVNFVAYLAHGTVEFRQHPSTLNVNKIWSWVVFTQTLMTVAKEHRGKIVGRTVNTGPAHTRQIRGLLRATGMRKSRDYDEVTLDAFKRLMKRLPRESRFNFRNGDAVNDNTDGSEASVEVVEAIDYLETVSDTTAAAHAAACSGHLVERTNSRSGDRFLGCSNYRIGCRYTEAYVEPTIAEAVDAANSDRFIAQAEREVECNCNADIAGVFGSHRGRNSYSNRCRVIARAEELESASFTPNCAGCGRVNVVGMCERCMST